MCGQSLDSKGGIRLCVSCTTTMFVFCRGGENQKDIDYSYDLVFITY